MSMFARLLVLIPLKTAGGCSIALPTTARISRPSQTTRHICCGCSRPAAAALWTGWRFLRARLRWSDAVGPTNGMAEQVTRSTCDGPGFRPGVFHVPFGSPDRGSKGAMETSHLGQPALMMQWQILGTPSIQSISRRPAMPTRSWPSNGGAKPVEGSRPLNSPMVRQRVFQ